MQRLSLTLLHCQPAAPPSRGILLAQQAYNISPIMRVFFNPLIFVPLFLILWVILFCFYLFFFSLPSGQSHGSGMALYLRAVYQVWGENCFSVLLLKWSRHLQETSLPPLGEGHLRSIPNPELTTGGLNSDSSL